jgi:uncharacterized protein
MYERGWDRVAAALVAEARRRAGVTQQDLARSAGVTQSVVSAYETGRRQPTVPTLCRLLAAAGFQPMIVLEPGRDGGPEGDERVAARVRTHRDEIRRVAARHGAWDVRVFGSAARGEDTPGSDVDLLVELDENADLFTLVRLERDLSALLGVDVDVIPISALGDRDDLAAEAVSL